MFLKKIVSSDVINMNVDFLYRVIKHPFKFMARMSYTKKDFNKDLVIDKKIGYKLFKKNELINTDILIKELKIWSARKIKLLDKKEIKKLTDQGSVKPYYLNLIELEDFKKIKSLKNFINSNELVNLLFEYYGFVPHLSHLAVFYSNNKIYNNNTGKKLGTQNAHFDNHDLKHVKLFLNISDVSKEDGPLHIFNKKISRSFRYSTGRILKRKPVRDDNELKSIKNSGKDFIGESGALAIVDTTNCLHYGSRVAQSGDRITLVIHFTCFDSYSGLKTKKYQDFNVAPHKNIRKEYWPIGN